MGIGTRVHIASHSSLWAQRQFRLVEWAWDLNADLSAALKRPVRIANDANCLALSEVVDGAAVGPKLCQVVLEPWAAGGRCINQQLVEGANASAANGLHPLFPTLGGDEQTCSPLLVRASRRLEMWISKRIRATIDQRGGEKRTAEEVIGLMRDGNEQAQASFSSILGPVSQSNL